jgi:hypothetical protein
MRVKNCIAIAAATLSLGAIAPAGASALSMPLPGPVPPSSCVTWPSQCLIQTRNGGFALSTHMVRAGHTLTGTVSNRCLYQNGTKPCPIFWSYMTDLGKVVHGCGDNDVTCTIKIRKSAPSSAYYVVNIGITSDQGTGWSSDYYAVLGRDQAVVAGKVHNKELQPVPGVDVAIFGGSIGNYEAVTGPDGTYVADVKRGSYRVWPSGRSLSSRHPPRFEPEHRDVSARPFHSAHANFKVDIGLVVKLTLSPSSVPADGFGIVQGTIKVTELGQPRPGVTVALWPKATESPTAAVTTGTRATVCGPSGRIWPGGTLADPAGESVNVTTDSNGTYQFTLDVGTVPGPFTVTAWARDSSGSLITHDTVDASDEQTVTATALGTHLLDEFIPSFDQWAPHTNFGSSITSDPNSILSAFEGLTQTDGAFKGYAYALGQGNSPAIVIYPVQNTPTIQRSGAVSVDANDLVLQPSAWRPIPGGINISDLTQVLRQGMLTALPTFTQWTQGTTVANWHGSAQSMQIPGQSFQYYGWPYPSAAPGSCS